MMHRVLFYYDNYCGESSRGGTEKATLRIAKALKQYGNVEVYNVYRNTKKGSGEDIYAAEMKLSKNSRSFVKVLASFIRENEIDTVVNMSRFFRHKLLAKSIERSGRDVRLMFMHHFAPGSESRKITYKAGFRLLRLDPFNPLYWLRASFYPLIKLPRKLSYKKIYDRVYRHSDKVILLSEGYFSEYAGITGNADSTRYKSIPNIYDAPSGLDKKEILNKKEKRILVLSRIDEIQKRISKILYIWKEIEGYSDLKDWKLDIVGDGHDAKSVRKLAKRLKLKNVEFHGWKDPVVFLKQSSLLLMTSSYEGLPLSLIEAQAYGCVPVVENSFASLQDIVETGKNGLIIPKDTSIENFALWLSEIMRDDKLRREMADKGFDQVNRYSSSAIADKWLKMFNERNEYRE